MQIRSTYFALPLVLAAGSAFAQASDEARAPLALTVTRPNIEEGTPGIAATAIDATEVQRSPAQSLPALLAQEPGVQFRDLYGGPGARSYIDLRGFGAVATQNTLTLLNGRRLNDIDNAGVEFLNIPADAIRRIEILRGNSAAVLYGDGAVGGAVNIIARPGAGIAAGNSVRLGAGSFGLREGSAAVSRSSRHWSIGVDGNAMYSDGWRVNNALEQKGINLEVRRFGTGREWYGTLATDTQHLGLPGARRVDPGDGENRLATDPQGAATPTDFVDQVGVRGILGFSRVLPSGAELVVDGGLRTKQQDSVVISPFGAAFDTTTNTRLATYSFTPRVRWEPDGRIPRGIAGLDYYYSDYNQLNRGEDPQIVIHRYDLKQHSLGIYGQGSRPIDAKTDVSAGLRLQHIQFIGGDILNPDATITFGGDPFDGHRESARFNDYQWAGHLGFEHALARGPVVFGRLGRAFRMPTVDERVLSSATYDSFALSAQTSWDAELGGRWRVGSTNLRASAYQMLLENEIHFNADTFLNENLEPTKRRGVEAGAEIALSRTLGLDLGAAWTRATFREGVNAGNDLPLVSKWTGSAALRWDFQPAWTLTTTVTAVGSRRMENDDDGQGPKIPGHGLLDMKVSTRQGAWTFAAQLNNVTDATYYNYAVRSSTEIDTYNAYPLPGRSWKVEAGLRF